MKLKPTRNPRYANGHRRRKLRAQILAEEDLCHICGQLVDKDAPHLDPGEAVIDEIHPVSKGGSPYARDNCRLRENGNVLHSPRRGDGTRLRPIVTPFVTARRW